MDNIEQADTQIKYWASKPVTEIADEILDRVEKYYDYLSYSGRLALYRRSWAYYYRPRLTGGALNTAGSQGELTTMSANHYRNLLGHLETMTTQQRMSYEPRARNSDVKSQAQVILSSNLLDYYSKEKKMDRRSITATKNALQYGDGFVNLDWDPTSGEEYGETESGAPIYQGDIKFTNYSPLNCIRDFTKTEPDQDSYFILRDFENKYDLAAKFPDLRKDILEDSSDMLDLARNTTLNWLNLEDSDNVAVYTLKHAPTPALPKGRLTKVLDNGTVLIDGPLPYKKTHVYRMAPDEEDGTIFGYSVAFDLLPMQEGFDILCSSVMTNQSTFGVQNILAPKGGDLSVSQVAGGLNMIEYDPKMGEVKSLNLTNTPPEIFQFMQYINTLMELISGVNSVARGQPEASLKSGAALALVQSMALQFSQNLQRAYVQLNEDIGTGAIELLQEFATVPRVAYITGKSNRPLMKYFKADDLDSIQRVTVDVGNPLSRTTAGRVSMAETFMNNGLVENADQYVQVVNTGRLEPVIEGKQMQLILIKAENENLADGLPVRVLVTDNHQKHILEHSIVLANTDLRMDPNSPIVAATLAHIEEHIMAMNNPQVQHLSAILHQEVIPSPNPNLGQTLDPTAPVQKQANGVSLPSAPNPPAGTDPNSQAAIEEQGQIINNEQAAAAAAA